MRYFAGLIACGVMIAASAATAQNVPIPTYGTPKVIYINNAKSEFIWTGSSSDFNTSVTIPAGWLKEQRLLRVRVGGYYIHEHPYETATVTFAGKLGSSTLATAPAVTMQMGEYDGNFWLEFDALCLNNEANLDVEATGELTLGATYGNAMDLSRTVAGVVADIDTEQEHNLKISASVTGGNTRFQITSMCVEAIE